MSIFKHEIKLNLIVLRKILLIRVVDSVRITVAITIIRREKIGNYKI